MYVVGLTGGIGSGKSTVASQFEPLGINVIDADHIARELVQFGNPNLQKISHYFGEDILLDDGLLNRSILRERIFNDQSAKVWLENLLHPQIQTEALKKIEAASGPYCIYMAPLLIENKLLFMVDRILVVDLPSELQLTRASERDDSNREALQRIIQSQVSRAERLEYADDIIDNSEPISSLTPKVQALHKIYCELAKQK